MAKKDEIYSGVKMAPLLLKLVNNYNEVREYKVNKQTLIAFNFKLDFSNLQHIEMKHNCLFACFIKS